MSTQQLFDSALLSLHALSISTSLPPTIDHDSKSYRVPLARLVAALKAVITFSLSDLSNSVIEHGRKTDALRIASGWYKSNRRPDSLVFKPRRGGDEDSGYILRDGDGGWDATMEVDEQSEPVQGKGEEEMLAIWIVPKIVMAWPKLMMMMEEKEKGEEERKGLKDLADAVLDLLVEALKALRGEYTFSNVQSHNLVGVRIVDELVALTHDLGRSDIRFPIIVSIFSNSKSTDDAPTPTPDQSLPTSLTRPHIDLPPFHLSIPNRNSAQRTHLCALQLIDRARTSVPGLYDDVESVVFSGAGDLIRSGYVGELGWEFVDKVWKEMSGRMRERMTFYVLQNVRGGRAGWKDVILLTRMVTEKNIEEKVWEKEMVVTFVQNSGDKLVATLVSELQEGEEDELIAQWASLIILSYPISPPLSVLNVPKPMVHLLSAPALENYDAFMRSPDVALPLPLSTDISDSSNLISIWDQAREESLERAANQVSRRKKRKRSDSDPPLSPDVSPLRTSRPSQQITVTTSNEARWGAKEQVQAVCDSLELDNGSARGRARVANLLAHFTVTEKNVTLRKEMRSLVCAGDGCLMSKNGEGDGWKCSVCDVEAEKSEKPKGTWIQCSEIVQGLVNSAMDHRREREDKIVLFELSARLVAHETTTKLYSQQFIMELIGALQETDREVGLSISNVLTQLLKQRAAVLRAAEEGEVPEFRIEDEIRPFMDRLSNMTTETSVLGGELALLTLFNSTINETGVLDKLGTIALVKLVTSEKPFISSLAGKKFLLCAKAKGQSPFKSVFPYFEDIALFGVTAPLVKILAILKCPEEVFQERTAKYTLPYLIIHGKKDAIFAMSKVLGKAPQVLCVENGPSIMCQMLMGTRNDYFLGKKTLLDILADPTVKMDNFIKSSHLELVLSLVQELGNERPDMVSQAKEALKTVAPKILSPSRTINDLLKGQSLHLVTTIGEMLANGRGKKSISDKKKLLRALRELVIILGPSVAIISIQLMSIFESWVERGPLRPLILNVWLVFCRTLNIDQLRGYVGQITACLLREWPTFEQVEIQSAIDILKHLVFLHGDSLHEAKFDIADFSGIHDEAMVEITNKLTNLKMKDNVGPIDSAKILLRRMLSHSELVSLQGTREFRDFLLSHENIIERWTNGDTFEPIVGEIISALLTIAIRSGGHYEEDIRSVALECIGIVGAVDADRVDFPQEEPPFILHHNFEDSDEKADFACYLLSSALVPSYRLLNDPKFQTIIAYAIQQLSKMCDFTQSLVDAVRNVRQAHSGKAANRFSALSKDAQETISSLLSSQYVDPPVQYSQYSCPIYHTKVGYQDWLCSWTLLLLSKVQGQAAKTIFEPFLQIIRIPDISIAQRLLPHLVQHVLLSGTDTDREEISIEIMAVLADIDDDFGNRHSKLQSAQLVFDLMDHLSLYVRRQRDEQQRHQSKKGRKLRSINTDEKVPLVLSILEQVPMDMMAQAAFRCKAYARSLMSFEQKITSMPKAEYRKPEVQKQLENLHEIYAELDEPDGMEGLSSLILSPSLQHQIRQHEATGKWTSAQSCWEVELQSTPNDLKCQLGLLRCLRNLGHYDTLQTHIRAVLQNHPEFSKALIPYTLETYLFTGDWKRLDELSDDLDINIPEVVFAYAIRAIRETRGDLSAIMQEARLLLAAPILAAGTNAYRRVYDAVTQLHMLRELELITQLRHVEMTKPAEIMSTSTVHPQLTARLNAVAPSFRIRESILRLRRTAFNLTTLDLPMASTWSLQQISSLWISSAKIARKAGHTQTAYTAILQAESGKAPFAFFEKAKFMRENNELSQAIQTMNSVLDNEDESSSTLQNNRSLWARCLLRRARWMDETDRYPDNKIVQFMKEARAFDSQWENSFFYLGRFYEYSRNSTLNLYHRIWEIIKAFSNALRLGTKFIYQALPKIVTMWLNFADNAELIKMSRSKEKGRETKHSPGGAAHYLNKINRTMEGNVETISTYQWLTVFPQLVSRILHKHAEVVPILQKLLVKVFLLFPHQAFWGLASALKSRTAKRAQRGENVLEKTIVSCNAKGQDPETQPAYGHSSAVDVIREGRNMVDGLLYLCDYNVGREKQLSMSKCFSRLNKCAPSCLMIPLQSLLTITLPSGVGASEHKPFPLRLVTFQRFEDQVDIMASLQKPRKITVIGSDRNSYSFLCKPKDDLRKDARLMEFNAMINKLLKKDAESRKRHLHIRTYSVVTLNEECGLIEWVPNTVVCRNVLMNLYSSMNIQTWSEELHDIFKSIRDVPSQTGSKFRDEILTRFPPVFRMWFIQTFPEPTSWLRARMAYARTAAVISMIGFVLGLGDRHCENILFDSTTGDTIHVDFNCLFDKGKTFEVPERVPFRLTQNIVDGLGVTGVEGIFRKACEVTMNLLRTNIDSLMSVLETLVHDPLVEWNESERKNKRRITTVVASADATVDPRIQEARKVLQEVENKLRGLQANFKGPASGRTVTTENQVESLIQEAMDDDNLGSMYVGWAAFL